MEDFERSRFKKFKAQREWAEPEDRRPDTDAAKERASVAADYEDDGWWLQFFKDRREHCGIFG